MIKYLSKNTKVSMADDWFEYANLNHFWMEWRLSVLKKYLFKIVSKESSILEVGCGNGVFRKQIEELGYIVDGCDLNLKALEMADQGKGDLLLYNIFDRNVDLLNKYQAIFLMDVIEHIENDNEFLIAALRHVKHNGVIIINVPANKYLYSNYDKQAGHIRRYSKKDIIKLMENIGLHVIVIRYWGFLLIPVIFLRKIVQYNCKKNTIRNGFQPQNIFIDKVLRLLKNIENIIPVKPFCGTSLLIIARYRK